MKFKKMLKDTKLNDTEQQILSYLEFHSDQILDIRIQKVAEDNYTSTSTVFRLAKKMGFSGYKELTYYLNNIHHESELSDVDENAAQNLATDIFTMMSENQLALKAFKSSLTSQPFIAIVANGYASIIGEYLYKKILTRNIRCLLRTSTDSDKLLENNLQDITHIIVISRSGETASLLKTLENVKENFSHIKTICFTQDTNNSIMHLSDIPFMIIDENKGDWDNVSVSQFHPFLLMYFEYMLEKLFKA